MLKACLFSLQAKLQFVKKRKIKWRKVRRDDLLIARIIRNRARRLPGKQIDRGLFMNNLSTKAPRAHAIAILAALGIAIPKSWNLARISKKCEAIARVLCDVIATHEAMQGAYFWRPAGNASARRATEFAHQYSFGDVEITQRRANSCRNVYYQLVVYREGKKKDVRELRAMVAQLEKICGKVKK